MTEIKIKQFSYINHELLENGSDKLTLQDDFLFYEHSCKAKVLDDKLEVPIEKYYRNKYMFIKKFVSNLEMWYANDSEIWCVDIECGGRGFTLTFKEQKEAEEVMSKIVNWRNS